MSLVKFKGKIISKEIKHLPTGLPVLKVLFKEEIDTTSPLMINTEVNYYEVLAYGKKTCLEYWNGWNDKLPDPVCEVVAKLTGRVKENKDGTKYYNLTLIHKSIKYNYEQRD